MGQTHSPPTSLPWCPTPPSLAFLAFPVCCIRQTPHPIPSQLAVPAILGDLQGWDQVKFSSDPLSVQLDPAHRMGPGRGLKSE